MCKNIIATEFIFATIYKIYFKKTNLINDILANVNNFFGLGQGCPFGAGYSIIHQRYKQITNIQNILAIILKKVSICNIS
jgi:hypothetical protein